MKNPVNILLAPNSFKESLNAVEITGLLKSNLHPQTGLNIYTAPISDGGDGFLYVIKYHFGGEFIDFKVSDPKGQNQIGTQALLSNDKKTIYIESSNVVGLKILSLKERDPINLNTRGLGELLKQIDVRNKRRNFNIKRVIIGVGGTGTADFGLGAAEAFGLKLLDHKNKILSVLPANYNKVDKIIWNKPDLSFEIELINDVLTPLFGKTNAIELYSIQKGASKLDIDFLLKGFTKIRKLLINNELLESNKVLNGAGGGLSAGLEILFGANAVSSEKFITEKLLREHIHNIFDVIITGEGSFDEQSLEGKATGTVINLFREHIDKIFIVCGKNKFEDQKLKDKKIKVIELQKYFSNKEESLNKIEEGITLASNEIMAEINRIYR